MFISTYENGLLCWYNPSGKPFRKTFFFKGPPGGSPTFFNINLLILFIYFWLCWVFVAAPGLSLVAASGAGAGAGGGLLFI